jgi:RNA polymerase subunit RPABC4/transcription elongation factor Spt4
MEFFILAILIGLIPAAIAKSKGGNFILWWLYGALLFIVALPHALIMKHDIQAMEQQQIAEGMKKCPFCAELVKQEATICRYCNRELPSSQIIKDLICPNCQGLNASNANFCEHCGKNLTFRAAEKNPPIQS